jgi:hypothetical protein
MRLGAGLLIKIRYSELPAGLHASAEKLGRHTVIHVLPGLSPVERRSAIDRLRASARVGHGPGLPAIPLALALMADRVRVTIRNAASAARLHPTGVAIPVIVLTAGAIMYALLVTVSVRLGLPVTSELALTPLPAAMAPSSPGGTPRVPVSDHPGGPAHTAGRTSDPPPARHTRPGHEGSTSPDPSARPTPGPSPSASPPPSSSPPGSASPSPSPTSTRGGGGKTGSCLNLGLFRVCL